jgi:hypothetical protein
MQALVDRYAGDATLVVAEGWKAAAVPSVEVRRGEPERTDGPLCRPEDPGVDRFIAVVEADVEAPPGATASPRTSDAPDWPAPARLDADDPHLGAHLADLVLRRLLPDLGAP